MQHLKIITGNLAIALFMGYQSVSSHTSSGGIKVIHALNLPDNSHHVDRSQFDTSLQYHNSWDWLMPVIIKLSDISIGGADEPNDTHYLRTFGMKDGDGKLMVRINAMPLHYGEDLLCVTYGAVVELVELLQSK